MKPKFAFELGDIVCIDPAGLAKGPLGKIIGRTEYIDGSVGYIVSSMAFGRDGIVRHALSECEIHRPEVRT